MSNDAWHLESFVDSLVVELDKTRETLAVKSINRPLTYSVKDLALELQIFPTFDGDNVQFTTAQPGQSGASKLSIQLASITDQQVRATSKAPPTKGDIRIDAVDLDQGTKRELRRLGVTSVNDLEQIQERNVDLPQASPKGGVDYKNLANLIQKAKRNSNAPTVSSASLVKAEKTTLKLQGTNLAMSGSHVPVAVLNGRLQDVVHASSREITIAVDAPLSQANDLILTLDPYCIVQMKIRDQESQ